MALPQERVALLSSDEGGGGGGSSDERTDSSEDEVTEHVRGAASPSPAPPRAPPPQRAADMAGAAHAQVPTISVTPHSPGVLDDSLQQLRRLHAAVQRMRAAPLPHLTGGGRLSTSCPSLCKDGETPETECGSPGHLSNYPGSRKGSGESRQWGLWEGGDEGRRRSWAALEPVPRMEPRRTRKHSGGGLNGHSVSLSSMESEGEGGVTTLLPRHSTHSLNEADLAKDFEKVTAALRAGLCLGSSALAGEAGRGAAPPEPETLRLQPRLPLQKSVSTPSIVAAIQPQLQPGAPAQQNILSAGAASDSESDDESVAPAGAVPGGGTPAGARRTNKHHDHLGLHQLEFLAQSAYDHHSEKRRKRGSLFFRKKKDKSRKASHGWQAAGAGGDCDWCGRALADKPALYCEHCTMTVHQNVCKDYIVECNKPKTSKTSVGKSLSASSGKSSKRSSLSSQSQAANSKKQTTGCYSPWRRVATKLGVHTSHICTDEKDGSDHKHDQSNASDDQGAGEWPEAYITADQLGAEALALGLGATEADTWGGGAPKSLARTLGDREQKRQEHIYELVLTEKTHCLTIRLMQKMFADGMIRAANVSAAQVDRMFPRLDELWALHSSLLSRLRARQRANVHVSTISDILLEYFSGATGDKFKSAYGEFCSRHHDAVDVFKDCCTREPRIARFIRKCQTNPLLRKKGVPECILSVAQRLTKYPLLLEPLLKTAGDDLLERERLQKALVGVKEILVDVNGQVAAKESEDRKLEIYHRIDAKSSANYRGRKFKKSDILQGNRSLKFEGMATLMQGRSKMQTLLVIVLTDCLFFLHDNNNKYTFFTPDNKTGVVSLVKLLVREKAGAEGRGLYLICSSPSEAEMFELRVHKPKDIGTWITDIRAAVQNCPEEEEESKTGMQVHSAEERQRQLEARHESIRLITEALRAKDREHASLLEDKMALHMRMAAATGGHTAPAPTLHASHIGVNTVFPGGLVVPDYVRLALPSSDTHGLWQEVCNVVKEALDASAVAWGGPGSGLGRSTSSAGERHSVSYESPALPRRADTFGGFDNHHKVRKVIEGVSENAEQPADNNNAGASETGARHLPDYMSGGEAAVKLQHCVYTLTCIIWQQLTSIHSLSAQLYAWRSCGAGGGGGGGAGGRCHDTQLEELRDAQARLTAERSAWEAQRSADREATANERRQLAAARAELAEQQKDVEQQRERLYRRLERLQQQQHGGSQEEMASVGTLSPDSSVSEPTRRKESKWRSNRGSTGSESSVVSAPRSSHQLPPQLLSAQNESRASAVAHAPATAMVKQQLPLKLASLSGNKPPAPGYHRLHDSPAAEQPSVPLVQHTRTGSSPAPLASHHPPPANNRATRTNTYPKLPDKFRMRSPETHAQAPAQQPPQPAAQPAAQHEEEVIYF